MSVLLRPSTIPMGISRARASGSGASVMDVSAIGPRAHRLLVVIDLGAILAKARAEVSGVVALFSAAALLGWLSHGLRSPGHR